MKNISIILLMLLLASCQLEKEKPDDNLNLRFEVLESEMKHIPTNIGIEESWDMFSGNAFTKTSTVPYKGLSGSYIKLAKIRVINEGKPISLFTQSKYYFATESWTSKGVEQNGTIHCGFGYESKIFLDKKDSTIIYCGYRSLMQANTDTLHLYLFWNRGSTGRDNIKFYLDTQKRLKYHSTEKIKRDMGDFYLKKCSIIPKNVVEDTIIR
jgi:hypothetical protein